MSKSIRDTILELVSEDLQIYSVVGKVVSINNGFAEIEPLDGSANLLDVRVVADSASSPVAIPLVNSIVICTFLDNDNAFISQISEVDKYRIANTSESLKSLLEDLIGAIQRIVVTTPAGPSTLPLVNDAEFTTIANRIPKLFD
jgi:hypothetical protein